MGSDQKNPLVQAGKKMSKHEKKFRAATPDEPKSSYQYGSDTTSKDQSKKMERISNGSSIKNNEDSGPE